MKTNIKVSYDSIEEPDHAPQQGDVFLLKSDATPYLLMQLLHKFYLVNLIYGNVWTSAPNPSDTAMGAFCGGFDKFRYVPKVDMKFYTFEDH